MWPFKNWSTVDFLAIGLAALCLSMVAKHLLASELGYAILSWIGAPLVVVGLVKLFSDL